MSCEIQLKIGDSLRATCKGDTVLEAVELAGELGEFPTKCGHCGGTDLSFTTRRARDKSDGSEYTFYGLKCNNPDCRRGFSFGQTKVGQRLYPKWKEGWLTFEEAKAKRTSNDQQGDYNGPPADPRGNAGDEVDF